MLSFCVFGGLEVTAVSSLLNEQVYVFVMEIEPSAIFLPEKKCFSFLGDIYTKCLSGEIY